jgi:hypothetical protein
MRYTEREFDLWNRDVPKPVTELVTEKPIVINRHQAAYEARVSGMTPEQQRDHMYMYTKSGAHYFKHIDTREYIWFPIPPDREDVVIEDGKVLRGYETHMGHFELNE